MIENTLRLLSSPVLAQEGLESPLKYGSIFGVIAAFIPVIAGVIGFALLGYLLYGAFLWMTSAGDPERLNQAQGTLTNGVIGFVLFAVMFALFWFLTVGVLKINWTEDIFSKITGTS